MLFVLLCFPVLLGVHAPHLLHEGRSRQSSPVAAPGCHHRLQQLISLTEKLLFQGDLVIFTNMQVPQALQQATSRDDFPKSLFVLQGRPQ